MDFTWEKDGMSVVRVQNNYHRCSMPTKTHRDVKLHIAICVAKHNSMLEVMRRRSVDDVQQSSHLACVVELRLATFQMAMLQRYNFKSESFGIFGTSISGKEQEKEDYLKMVGRLQKLTAQRDFPELQVLVKRWPYKDTDPHYVAASTILSDAPDWMFSAGVQATVAERESGVQATVSKSSAAMQATVTTLE